MLCSFGIPGKAMIKSAKNPKKGPSLLAIEPYFDGSHRHFLEGLASHCCIRMDLRSLPAHSWKWRMRFAAPFFAAMLDEAERFDAVLCSSMLDVAAFRGLAPSWTRTTRLVTYFHENQFAYPTRKNDERDLHFAVTNLTTALASDCVVFNSKFNRDTFFTGAEELLGRMPNMRQGIDLEKLRSKVTVLPPPIDFDAFDRKCFVEHNKENDPGDPLIVWNHRWEHDKNPERFLAALHYLQKKKIPFRLALLGQSFRQAPQVFAEMEKCFARQIVHFGYAPPDIYCTLLRKGTVVVSTALHEFYGIAVLEAVRAGCRPLLPDRLSYPEIFPPQYLYKEYELEEKLIDFLQKGRLPEREARALTEEKSWRHLAPSFLRLFL